jgi:glutathione synthase/RimK-type ligase-like ATP-grasp enzyme
MNLHLVGIRRKTEFSPNHVENDLLIINGTAENLRAFGATVTMVDEDSLGGADVRGDVIFSMVQGPAGTRRLKEIVAVMGALAINTPQSVEQCYRINMVRKLPQGGIPFPRSIIVSTNDPESELVKVERGARHWVKRGDVHAVHREDVVQVSDGTEARMILREFRKRGIGTAVLQEHIIGDTVKFYAVRETSFFHWYYLNGVFHTPFDEMALRSLAARSAGILGLYVFGGDAIIRPDGSITIIDINDWPSFAPVRDEAGRQIAQMIFRKAQEFVHAAGSKQKVANQD